MRTHSRASSDTVHSIAAFNPPSRHRSIASGLLLASAPIVGLDLTHPSGGSDRHFPECSKSADKTHRLECSGHLNCFRAQRLFFVPKVARPLIDCRCSFEGNVRNHWPQAVPLLQATSIFRLISALGIELGNGELGSIEVQKTLSQDPASSSVDLKYNDQLITRTKTDSADECSQLPVR